jgi:hypothetical protein
MKTKVTFIFLVLLFLYMGCSTNQKNGKNVAETKYDKCSLSFNYCFQNVLRAQNDKEVNNWIDSLQCSISNVEYEDVLVYYDYYNLETDSFINRQFVPINMDNMSTSYDKVNTLVVVLDSNYRSQALVKGTL